MTQHEVAAKLRAHSYRPIWEPAGWADCLCQADWVLKHFVPKVAFADDEVGEGIVLCRGCSCWTRHIPSRPADGPYSSGDCRRRAPAPTPYIEGKEGCPVVWPWTLETDGCGEGKASKRK